jgi:hypothetical protein
MRIATIIFLASVLLLAGCKKESIPPSCTHGIAATIINTGPVNADGCDVLIRIDSTNIYYHPVNLDSIHKINGLKIYMEYTLTGDSFACGDFVIMYHKAIHLDCIGGR